MNSMLTLTFFIFMTVIGLSLGHDDCAAEVIHGDNCCNMNGIRDLHSKEIAVGCKEKYFKGPLHSSAEMKNAVACAKECIFSGEGLLTEDRKLDKSALIKFFTPYEAVYGPALYGNLDKCLDSYEANVDSSLECKTGVNEFVNCFFREAFLNCPSSLWTASSECDEMKANVKKCPNVVVMLASAKDQ